MDKKIENLFFWGEVVFLLIMITVSMYSIFFDKDLYVWVGLLAIYVFAIKGLKRIFTNAEKLKRVKTKVTSATYLGLSTIASGTMLYAIASSITL